MGDNNGEDECFKEERRKYLKKILWTRENGYFKKMRKNEKTFAKA